MVGGSGMYLDAVCSGIDDIPTVEPEIRKKLQEQYQSEGIESLRIQLKMLDPIYYETVDLRNPNRILKGLEISIMTGKPYSSFLTRTKKKRDFSILKIGVNWDRNELYDRINRRVDQMVEVGLLEEARNLYSNRELHQTSVFDALHRSFSTCLSRCSWALGHNSVEAALRNALLQRHLYELVGIHHRIIDQRRLSCQYRQYPTQG